MGILEQKKTKLGVNNLDFNEQKELYEGFVNVGGKVVKLQQDPNHKINTKLSRYIEAKEETEKKRLLQEEKKKSDEIAHQKMLAEKEKIKKMVEESRKNQRMLKPPVIQENKAEAPDEPNPTQDYFSRLAAVLVCIIYGIFNIFGKRFSKKFLNITYYDLQNGLIEAKQILASIIHQDKSFSSHIKDSLASTGFPYYYELLYRFDEIYDPDVFNTLKDLKAVSDPIARGKTAFIKLFKKILILNRYHPSINIAFEKALSYEKELRKMDESIFSANYKKLNKIYTFIFLNYLPKILNLVDFYFKDEIFHGKKIKYRDFINIVPEDMIGFYTKLWAEEEVKEKLKLEQEERQKALEEQEKLKQEKEKGDMPPLSEAEKIAQLKNLPDSVGNGIRIIEENLNFKEILSFYHYSKDPREIMPINDKVFLTFSIMEFFDKEFSFLFVTSSVQFNIISDKGQRIDIRNNLKDIYFHTDDIYKSINEYIKILHEIRKNNTNTYMLAKEQYTKLQQLSLQRSQLSKLIRRQSGQLFENFKNQFKIIVDDYNYDRRIIQNPEDIQSFDTRILGKKISHRQRIIEVFNNGFSVASALHYLVNEGELSGISIEIKQPVFLKFEIPAENENLNENTQLSDFPQ